MKVSLLLAAGILCHGHFTFLESNFLTGRDLIRQVMKSAFKALSNNSTENTCSYALSEKICLTHFLPLSPLPPQYA